MASQAGAQEPGLAFLKINSLAHSAPFGFGAVVLPGNSEAAMWNPAGLATASGGVSFSYGSWLQQIRFGSISGSWPLDRRQAIGAMFYYMNLPGIERRFTAVDVDPADRFDAANLAMTLAYGLRATHGLFLGTAVKMLRQSIDRSAASALAVDFGCYYSALGDRLGLAAVMKNIGPPLKMNSSPAPLPHLLDAGIRLTPDNAFDLLAGLRSDADHRVGYHVAGEWHTSPQSALPDNRLALRLGYQFKDDRSMLKGIKAGLGIDHVIGSLMYSFDYAYVPFNILGTTHLFSLSIRKTAILSAAASADKRVFSPHLDTVQIALTTRNIPRPQRWQLIITGDQGLLKRAFEGDGAPPEFCTWRGEDQDQRILPDGVYRYQLTVQDDRGRAVTSDEKRIVVDGRPPDIRLKISPGFIMPGDSSVISLFPSLVKTIETDFMNPVDHWTVRAMDRGRNTLKLFEGHGEPPQTIRWNPQPQPGAEPVVGSYYFVASAVDVVGNIGYSDTLSCIVGYRLPVEVRKVIQENIEGFKITLGSILFDFDRSTLRPAAARVLNNVALILQERPKATAVIGGHTDAMGSELYNQELSFRRSEEVRRYLCEVLGVAAGRLQVQWFGKSRPVADNSTEAGRQLNRRVEINISLKPQAGP